MRSSCMVSSCFGFIKEQKSKKTSNVDKTAIKFSSPMMTPRAKRLKVTQPW